MITNKSSSAAQSESILVDVAPRETGEQDSASKRVDPNEKHLNTDHLLGDLKGRTISGTFITIAAQAIKFLLNLAFIMALARLLSPKDFGLYAMVTTIMGFLWIFQDIGLSTATVQRQEITSCTGVQSVLGKRRCGWCCYTGRCCLGAGNRMVLSRTAACRYHARAFDYLSPYYLGGSTHCAVKPADAFRGHRDDLMFPACLAVT